MKQAVGFGLALVVLANGFAWIVRTAGIDRDLVYTPWALVLLAGAVLWARARGVDRADVGLAGGSWRRSATSGLLIAIVVCAAPLVFFRLVFTGPVRYAEIEHLSGVGLIWRLAVELTLAVAFTEEVLFRGILQALFKRSLGLVPAITATNTFFGLWHIVVAAASTQQNTAVLPPLFGLATPWVAYLGALAAVGVGGGILSALREKTGHLAGSIIVHWMFDAALTAFIYV